MILSLSSKQHVPFWDVFLEVLCGSKIIEVKWTYYEVSRNYNYDIW